MKHAKSTSPLEQWRQRLRPVAAKAALRDPIERPGRELERPRTVIEAAEELGFRFTLSGPGSPVVVWPICGLAERFAFPRQKSAA